MTVWGKIDEVNVKNEIDYKIEMEKESKMEECIEQKTDRTEHAPTQESALEIQPSQIVDDSNNVASDRSNWPKLRFKVIGAVGLIVFVIGLTVGLITSTSRRSDIDPPERFSAKLSMFSSAVLEGYPVCSELQSDLEEAARYITNVKIDQFANNYFGKDGIACISCGILDDMQSSAEMDSSAGPVAETFSDVSGSGGKTSLPESKNAGVKEDSFGTNNQVEGVDEADVVKTDGKVVYAAYGNKLVLWNATSGEELSRTLLPTSDTDGVDRCPTEYTDFNAPCYGGYSDSSAIQSLLLHKDKIVVIASSFGSFSIQGQRSSSFMASMFTRDKISHDVQQQPALSGYRETRVFVYDLSDIPTDQSPLPLLTQHDLRGSYQSARSIGKNAHIVTRSSVNDNDYLTAYLNPWESRYEGMLENEYRTEAYKVAETLIPVFAQKVANEIAHGIGTSNGDGYLESNDLHTLSCEQISRVALMLTEDDANDNETFEEDFVSLFFTGASVLTSFTQVTSFDILGAQDDASNNSDYFLATSTSGAFLPSSYYSTNTYSSKEKLVVAGEGYKLLDDGSWHETTYFLAYHLKDDISTAISIGQVPGSLLNQFSMDHYYDEESEIDYLRVATTTRSKWGYQDNTWQELSESSSQVTILKFSNDDSVSDVSSLEVVGQASGLGKGERIYAVRFFGNTGYVVTFRETDPFYTIDLTDPTNPVVMGELKIPGFSNYLHPIESDNEDVNLILAVGQDANDQGRALGLQIALFDVTDLANPMQIHKYVEKPGDGTNWFGSSSEAQYDHKAFRYLPETKVLILPASWYEYPSNGFDGFLIYNIDEVEGISERFQISHVDSSQIWDGCWDRRSIAARSLVFGGDVTTIKKHSVLTYNLETKEKLWELRLDKKDKDSTDCYPWYW